MSRLGSLALAAVVLGAPVQAATSASTAARQTALSVPGTAVTWTGLRLGGGRQALVALVRPLPPPTPSGGKHPPAKGPASPPWRLVRVDADSDGKPQTSELAVGVPEGTADLAALDLDGDGRDELVLGGGAAGEAADAATLPVLDQVVDWAGPTPRVVRLRSGADARLDARVTGQVTDGAGRELLCLAAVGKATCLALVDGALQPVGVPLALPVRPTRDRFALELVSPAVAALPRSATDALALAVGPEAVGGRRLRSRLLGLDGSASEVWSLLPGPEEVVASRYLRLDGRPALAVATLDRAKMNVFGEQRLRVFLLAADRTRAGSPPVLAVETDSHAWFPLDLAAADQDGDGQTDLVVLSQEGLGGGDLAVLVFRGLGEGRLEKKPMRLSVDNAREAAFSDDVDGDGRHDLVVQDKTSLTVRLAADAADRRPVGKSPRVTFAAADDGKRQVTVSVGGEGARVDQAPAPAVEEDAGPQVGVSEDGADDETADEDLTAVGEWVPPVTGSHPLVVLDLDGDGRGEVLRLVSDDEAATRVLVYRLPR
jgi:hypothetical protein